MLPTHRLKVLNKKNNRKSEVGAGWLNKDGSITIQLDECVVIKPTNKHVYTLFPI